MRSLQALSVVAALCALACSDEVRTLSRTQVTMRISATPEVRAQLASLRVHVQVDDGERASRTYTSAELAMWPVDLHVLPGADNDSTAQLSVIAEALDARGVVMVQQRARTAFLPREKRILPVALARCGGRGFGFLCADLACVGDACETCVVDACAQTPYLDPSALMTLDDAPAREQEGPSTIEPPPPPSAVPGASAPLDCAAPDSPIRCDDGQVCNGVERCAPDDAMADARGCVLGAPIGCAMGETCIEAMGGCSVCALASDADGDGAASRTCGGDDCDDSDPTRFPKNPEFCDAKDNDCNGAVDDADAAASCPVPAGGVAMCGMRGICEARCSDPDFDLIAGACMRHDDCAGVTACGGGQCVDGARSFTCQCGSGLTGTGTTACGDLDECAANTLGCDTSPPACLNQPGSAVCRCPATHFGSGIGEAGCQRKATKISVGNGYACAVLDGGGVKCWGANSYFKLGTGDPNGRGAAPGQMGDALPFVNFGPGRTAASVLAGSDVSCAILDDRTVKCWGFDGYGSVSGASMRGAQWAGAMGNGLPIAPLPMTPRAKELAAGGGYAFALLDDGSLVRWGPTATVFEPGAGNKATAFARSTSYDGAHYCAIVGSGQVVCWGALIRDQGQLGSPAPLGAGDSYLPVALGTGRRALALALGDAHSCALLDDASVKCWGDNTHGQLGLGDALPRGLAVGDMGDALPSVALPRPTRAIAAGRHHTCALLDDGSVRCWGLNDLGQLGRGVAGNVGLAPGEIAALAPIDLGPGRTALAIEAGTHTCALLDHGGVKCWGPNESGQLGQGHTMPIGAAGGMGAALPEIDLGS